MSTKTNRKKYLIIVVVFLCSTGSNAEASFPSGTIDNVAVAMASLSLGAAGTWTEKADMPTPRLALASSVVDGKIYAIGGRAEGTLTTEYDPATDTWTTKTRMPTSRFGLATSVVDGKIYATGGIPDLGLIVQNVEAYDPQTDTWTKKADLPKPIGFLSTSVVDGKIYAIGGTPVMPWVTYFQTVYAYDPQTDTWTEKAPMPTARAFLSTCVVDGKIYAIGGALASKTMLSTVEVYDPSTDTWTTKSPMPTARFGHATAVVDGIIYAIGGGTHTPSCGFSVVEAYDPATDTWTTKADMPAPTCWHSTGVVDGKIYAFGGSAEGYNLHPPGFRTVYEYDPNPLVVDFNDDGIVDGADICMMVEYWHTDEPFYDIAPPPFGDGIVDVQDLILLSEHLFEEILPPGCVAYWRFDQTEGNIAHNSAGFNDGICHGEPIWQSTGGRLGGALQFDGMNDYVETDFVLSPPDGAFSAVAWIKGGAPGQVIVSQTDGNGTGQTWLGMDPSSGELMTGLAPTFGRSPSIPLTSEYIISGGQWHHVGIVVAAFQTMQFRYLYLDGERIAMDIQSVSLPFSNGGLYIGADKKLDTSGFFSGLIDDVRIYDVALTAEQIAALAQ